MPDYPECKPSLKLIVRIFNDAKNNSGQDTIRNERVRLFHIDEDFGTVLALPSGVFRGIGNGNGVVRDKIDNVCHGVNFSYFEMTGEPETNAPVREYL
ncbi:hypothetical protein O3W52_03155 [Ensifer psoraleae]|uniref:Uncharacterized protein n=1 Tax=Sinorhizobium psoraleae TaxID=520838 RepID=A0ABT4KB69_9HYPH|nr:hypothetical protein [Sinorhizobium psoraleae]